MEGVILGIPCRCYGGGIFIKGSSLRFTGSNCFSGNSAMQYGGGVYAGSNSCTTSTDLVVDSVHKAIAV